MSEYVLLNFVVILASSNIQKPTNFTFEIENVGQEEEKQNLYRSITNVKLCIA